MKPRLKLVMAAAFTILALSGCQTTAEKFASLEKGMKKPEVLDIMGSPDRRQRWRGLDRWTYFYVDKKNQETHEVHFDQGIATYIGEKYRPEVTAEAQDAQNDLANREVEARVIRQREAANRNLENYENEIRGTGEASFLPTYEPVQ